VVVAVLGSVAVVLVVPVRVTVVPVMTVRVTVAVPVTVIGIVSVGVTVPVGGGVTVRTGARSVAGARAPSVRELRQRAERARRVRLDAPLEHVLQLRALAGSDGLVHPEPGGAPARALARGDHGTALTLTGAAALAALALAALAFAALAPAALAPAARTALPWPELGDGDRGSAGRIVRGPLWRRDLPARG
jgi:hypothetical protein